MKKRQFDFDISLPQSVNADHQTVEVYHGEPLYPDAGKPDDPFELPVKDTGGS